MKSRLLTLIFVTILISAFSQEKRHQFNAGFQLGQYQKDFGIGLQVTTPYFAKQKVAFRLRGNLMFNEHIHKKETTWTPYSNLSLGIIGVAGEINDKIRLYGEGGALFIFPSTELSSEQMEFGGYGLFGFEFFMSNGSNYFIEIGGVGTGAIADKVLYKPIYSNGLIINTGFRFFF
ncbi:MULTISPECIES: hypothetical protein [unclassified Lentimicrobium]|uniref:hypothetical protein n=1 Tax=unclassified Lentimicrobium TaxID=2677434 RepID=UPI001557A05B|nr:MULTISPECIES: hypothetical protein [unclassified Lentimicrobium]NPD45245.1 hypothetical protein [Lentimicrobium sp. S6]NPD85424.1 hypothetical protein [Lentimicrobium sp. L6]